MTPKFVMLRCPNIGASYARQFLNGYRVNPRAIPATLRLRRRRLSLAISSGKRIGQSLPAAPSCFPIVYSDSVSARPMQALNTRSPSTTSSTSLGFRENRAGWGGCPMCFESEDHGQSKARLRAAGRRHKHGPFPASGAGLISGGIQFYASDSITNLFASVVSDIRHSWENVLARQLPGSRHNCRVITLKCIPTDSGLCKNQAAEEVNSCTPAAKTVVESKGLSQRSASQPLGSSAA